nr:uncharacterized protein LOC113827059 [Penaeus vannamei]
MVMFPRYLSRSLTHGHQTAPWWWVNMNALTVISVAALVASGSASLLAYNGVYGGHHGLLGAYPYAGYSGVVPYSYAGGLPAAASLTIKTPIIKTLAPTPISYNVAPAPVSYNVAPVLYPTRSSCVAPVAPVQSQYHAQDEIGQYSFGYAGGASSRAESRDAFGVVRGSYNYVDSEGKVQTQHYVADALGFRASGTNLPVAPDAPLAALPGPVPEPVQDTAEVVAAKLAHFQAYNEAAAAAAAAPDTRKKRSVLAAPGLGVYSPLRFSYGFSTPSTTPTQLPMLLLFTTLPPIPPSPPTTPSTSHHLRRRRQTRPP